MLVPLTTDTEPKKVRAAATSDGSAQPCRQQQAARQLVPEAPPCATQLSHLSRLCCRKFLAYSDLRMPVIPLPGGPVSEPARSGVVRPTLRRKPAPRHGSTDIPPLPRLRTFLSRTGRRRGCTSKLASPI